MVKRWESVTNKTSTCDGAQNKAINQCIKRNIFVQCPTAERNSSANCTKLFEFAKNCPGYPIYDNAHGRDLNGQIVEKSVKGAQNVEKKKDRTTKSNVTTKKMQGTTQKPAAIPAKAA